MPGLNQAERNFSVFYEAIKDNFNLGELQTLWAILKWKTKEKEDLNQYLTVEGMKLIVN